MPGASPGLVGRVRELAALDAAFRAGRPVLIEGPHGVGKSVLIAQLCRRSGIRPVVVHGSVALTAAGLVGSHDPAQVLRSGYRPGAFQPGPLVTAMRGGMVLCLDEANRVPADVLSVLISVLSEARLEVPRYGPVVARPGFRFVAAVNPLDGTGTGALPEAFRDRLVRLTLGYQSAADERSIVRSQLPDADAALVRRAVHVTRASRRHPDVRLGASVRGAADLVAVAAHLRRFGHGEPGLAAALLALSAKIVLRPGVDRPVEAVIRELWAHAVIAEHRAARHPAADGAAGPALPPSSVLIDDEGEALGTDEGAPAGPASVRHPPGDPAGGGRAASGASRLSGQGDGDDSGVAAQTRQAISSFVRSAGRGRAPRRPAAGSSLPVSQDDIERMAASIVVSRAHGQLPRPGKDRGRFATVRYAFRSDDLDLDRTVAELAADPVPDQRNLWVHDSVPRRRAIVLMLDVSGSMRGDRSVEAATATAAAALATETDELGVVAFGTSAEVLKSGPDELPPKELVRRVLGLRPHGLTDLSAGLSAGRQLLGGMRSSAHIAIVMTDGVQNHGTDPLLAATSFQHLNVLATTDSPWRLRQCERLAAAGRGRCLGYASLDRLPAVISTLLSG
jgi:MoxR-like ATPase/Mg-chelatase subunit ChlD